MTSDTGSIGAIFLLCPRSRPTIRRVIHHHDQSIKDRHSTSFRYSKVLILCCLCTEKWIKRERNDLRRGRIAAGVDVKSQ